MILDPACHKQPEKCLAPAFHFLPSHQCPSDPAQIQCIAAGHTTQCQTMLLVTLKKSKLSPPNCCYRPAVINHNACTTSRHLIFLQCPRRRPTSRRWCWSAGSATATTATTTSDSTAPSESMPHRHEFDGI